MTETLRDFLIEVACHPEHMRRFIDDPRGELTGWGHRLSDDEIRAIESRDPDLLRSVLGFGPRDLPQLTGIRKGGKKTGGAVKKGASKKKTARKPARKRKSSR